MNSIPSRLPQRPLRMPRASMAGLSLIELMVAMVLGLLVVLAAIGLFTSNRAVYGSSEALARIQENARAGFELMARDIRAADGTACRNPVDPSSTAVVSAPGKLPLVPWQGAGVRWGYLGPWGDGLVGKGSADGNDVIELRTATMGAVPITEHTPGELGHAGPPRFNVGDELLVCDSNNGYLLAVGAVVGSSVAYKQASCAMAAGCDDLVLDPARRPAFLAPVIAARWQVEKNPRGGRSLYRLTPGHFGDANKAEIIDGVRSLKLQYLLPGKIEYVSASQVGTNWKEVRAVRIALELEASPGGSTGDEVGRRIVHVVSLRNRGP